jgi:predicted nucleic acid-binding protein
VAQFVLDTNVYIAGDRDTGWAEELARFSSAFLPSIHFHSVVAQELLAGAVNARRRRLVEESLVNPFERRGRVVTPTFAAWKDAGRVVSQLVERKLISAGGFKRSFLNDCLLATSCREKGLCLITLNRSDFDLIDEVYRFDYLEPWPD